MTQDKLQEISKRPYDDYLVESRDYRIGESFSDRDQRYAMVDKMLRGEWGFSLPGSELVSQAPMVMNLGLAMVNDVARLVPEQAPVYKANLMSDKKEDAINGAVREEIARTIWEYNRGDLYIPQQAIDLVVTGAMYTVVWYEDGMEHPAITRLDPRHCYPTIANGMLKDLLVVHVYPAHVAEALFPGMDIYKDSQAKSVGNDVEIWEYYSEGYALRAVCHLSNGRKALKGSIKDINSATYDIDCPPVGYAQLPSHDGAQRGVLDQLNDSLQAKNKIAALMTMYTEHKVFAPWEAKNILNVGTTPGPNTVYEHDPNAQDSFMRRVDTAGSDPQLFALMNLLDLDQRGGIGYPASRQGEVGQSIASAAFVESTQGQLSSIVKAGQNHEADVRSQVLEVAMKMEVAHSANQEKMLLKAVGKKKKYTPSKDIEEKTKINVQYGAGAGMSRENADNRVLNLLGARIIDRGTARDNIEFLRDRIDIQDKIEMENAEDALQQLFWPDPNVPIGMKFEIKKLMTEDGLSLSAAFEKVSKEAEAQAKAKQEAQAQAQAAPPEQIPGQEAPVDPQAATTQALALEKGQQVSEPADIDLPPAPMQQSFISG